MKAAAPGLLLTAAIAAAAGALRSVPGLTFLSPMILAIGIGATLRGIFGVPAFARDGIQFSLRRILRLAIVLLGFQLTATQVTAIGIPGVAILAASLLATFAFTMVMARILRVERKLGQLIAAGTSICGASAIVATNAVTRAPDEDAAYAVACVTLFGSLSMVLYPLLLPILGLGADAYGVWAGASIHEVAQVVAAAFQGGAEAGHVGTVAKLSRVVMLAPMVVALGWVGAAGSPGSGVSRSALAVPWFIVGFVALAGLSSAIPVAPVVDGWIASLTAFLLAMALAAMGLEIDARRLRAKGFRPLALAAASWIFIAVFALTLVKLWY